MEKKSKLTIETLDTKIKSSVDFEEPNDFRISFSSKEKDVIVTIPNESITEVGKLLHEYFISKGIKSKLEEKYFSTPPYTNKQ